MRGSSLRARLIAEGVIVPGESLQLASATREQLERLELDDVGRAVAARQVARFVELPDRELKQFRSNVPIAKHGGHSDGR